MTELEKLNVIRERNGMLPLTELPKSPEKLAEEAKAAEEENKKKIEAEAETKRLEDEKKKNEEAERQRKEKEAKEKEVVQPELNDDVVLAYLQKKNPSIKSFDALAAKPSPEDVEKEKEVRESNKFAWGFKNGKLKKQDLENFIIDTKNPSNLIFDQFAAKAKAANPEIKSEEVTAMFNERFSLDKDPESWQYQQGQEELNILAGQMISKKYSNILSLEREYSQFEQAENNRSSIQSKILANAPAYKKDVEEVFEQVSTYRTKIGEHTYEVPLPEEFLNRAKSHLLSEEFAEQQIIKGWNKEELGEIALNMALIENREYINQKIVEQDRINHQKGTRGIAADLGQRSGNPEVTVDEKKQKAAERHGAVVPTTP